MPWTERHRVATVLVALGVAVLAGSGAGFLVGQVLATAITDLLGAVPSRP